MDIKKLANYLLFWRATDVFRENKRIASRFEKQVDTLIAKGQKGDLREMKKLANNETFRDLVDLVKIDLLLHEEDPKLFPERLVNLIFILSTKEV
jgi:hypothetical protein